MDVSLNDNQKILQQTTRRFLADRAPIGSLRKIADGKAQFDSAAWRACAGQGWLAVFTPEVYGGMAEDSQGVVDASIIAEELGRVAFAGPFLTSSVVAFALARAGTEAQCKALLPGLNSGELRAAWCFAGAGPRAGLEAGAVRAARDGGGYVLSGKASYVEEATEANWLLVSAIGDDGLTQFIIPTNSAGVTVEPLRSLDLGRRTGHVRFDNLRLGADAVLGVPGKADADFERQLQVAVVLQCAETVGVVDRTFEFTLEYVKERVAFGRPIGAFQALKHRLADWAAQLEGAKALTAHAARAVQNDAPDAAIAISIAKSHCGRSGTEIIRDCLQMHGGIGMTWDHDIHFYLRRAVANEAMWGSPPAHHERLCRLAGL